MKNKLLTALAAALMLCSCGEAESSVQTVSSAESEATGVSSEARIPEMTAAASAAGVTATESMTSPPSETEPPAETTALSKETAASQTTGSTAVPGTSPPVTVSRPPAGTSATAASTSEAVKKTEASRKRDDSSSKTDSTSKPESTSKQTEKPPETETVTDPPDSSSQAEEKPKGILSSPEDIALTDTDGRGRDYTFIYGGKTFTAHYTPDNWQIVYSYLITLRPDMELIAAALIAEHPIHGRDMISYRVPSDMADEWEIHNMLYMILPEGPLKLHARDVDFDPDDQGLTLAEMYMRRFG